VPVQKSPSWQARLVVQEQAVQPVQSALQVCVPVAPPTQAQF
jgi:hypothetical protein